MTPRYPAARSSSARSGIRGFDPEAVYRFAATLADGLGIPLASIADDALNNLITMVLEDASRRGKAGERPALSDYTATILEALRARAPTGSPGGGGGGGGGGGAPPLGGGSPPASGPSPPLPPGPLSEVAKKLSELARRAAVEARSRQGPQRQKLLEEATNRFNQAVEAGNKAGDEARAAYDRAQRARKEMERLQESYDQWRREHEPIDNPADDAERTRRADEIGKKEAEVGDLESDAEALARKAKEAMDAIDEAKKAIDAATALASPTTPDAGGGGGEQPVPFLSDDMPLEQSLLPEDFLAPSAGADGTPAAGQAPPGDSPHDPCCCSKEKIAALLVELLGEAAVGGDGPCAKGPVNAPDDAMRPGRPDGNQPPPQGNPPAAGPMPSSPPPAPPQGAPPGTTPGADPSQTGPRQPTEPMGPMVPMMLQQQAAPPMSGPTTPDENESTKRHETQVPALDRKKAKSKVPSSKEKPAKAGVGGLPPPRTSGYGRFKFVYGDFEWGFRKGTWWSGGLEDQPDEARELQFLTTLQRNGPPWIRLPERWWPKGLSRTEVLARAKVLEQILHTKYGWRLMDSFNWTADAIVQPMWRPPSRPTSRRPPMSLPSAVWALTKPPALHASYYGVFKGPRWGTTNCPSAGQGKPAKKPETSSPRKGSPRDGPRGKTLDLGRTIGFPRTTPGLELADPRKPAKKTATSSPGKGAPRDGPLGKTLDPNRIIGFPRTTPGLELTEEELRTVAEVFRVMRARTRFFGLERLGGRRVSELELDPSIFGRTLSPRTGDAEADYQRYVTELEAMILRSMAAHPDAWTRGHELLMVAVHVAAALAVFVVATEGAAILAAAGGVKGAIGTVALVLLHADGVVTVVECGIDGIQTLIRGDVYRQAREGATLAERTEGFGHLLEAGVGVSFLAFVLRGLGRTMSKPKSLPGLLPTEPTMSAPFLPGVRPRGASWASTPTFNPYRSYPLRRRLPLPQPFGPTRPFHSNRPFGIDPTQLRTDEIDRVLALERLWGRSTLTPKRFASFIRAHRIPDHKVREMATMLKKGDWKFSERGALLRSGFAGYPVTAEYFANLYNRYGNGKVTFDNGAFLWTGTTTRLQLPEVYDFSLYERLYPRFTGANQGTRFVSDMPFETSDARLRNVFRHLRNVDHEPGNRPTTVPENGPPFQFNNLPPRFEGRGATQGILHVRLRDGSYLRLDLIVGSPRANRPRLIDIADAEVRKQIRENNGGRRQRDLKALEFSSHHAETHAAWLMRKLGAEEGWVDINNIDGPCSGCRTVVSQFLPDGSTLHIRYQRRGSTVMDPPESEPIFGTFRHVLDRRQ